MYLSKESCRHVNSITYEGKVIVFATDAEGQTYYTVKQDGYEDSYASTELLGWEDWQALDFLDEVKEDESVKAKEKAELTYLDSADEGSEPKYLLRSHYRDQAKAAVAPVQVVAGMGHLYVFRQSKRNTLLVDRFVLDGLTNKLVRKLEVRFKRSRQRYTPLENPNGAFVVDSLNYYDANGNSFYEPTLELSCIENLTQGWFSVVLLPTHEQEQYRWHIFAYNTATDAVELTSIHASDEGLFDFRDRLVLEPAEPESPEILLPQTIPGLVKQTLTLTTEANTPLQISQGLTATKYDLQAERQTQAGAQLLKTTTRVMLAVATEDSVAALSFAADRNGLLSQLDGTFESTVLRGDSRELLLPLNTLDDIRAFANTAPVAEGVISGMTQDESGQVRIVSDQAGTLAVGDVIEINGTRHYNGHYVIHNARDNVFMVTAPQETGEAGPENAGTWKKVVLQKDRLIFDGAITAFNLKENGTLRVTSPNHGLDKNESVQIVNTQSQDGTFTVTAIDEEGFTIDTKWQPGEAVNLTLVSKKRRGTTFVDNAYIKTPTLGLTAPSPKYSFGETYSAWIYRSEASPSSQVILAAQTQIMELYLHGEQLRLTVAGLETPMPITSTTPLALKEWVHVAGSFAYDKRTQKTHVSLCQDGVEVASAVADGMPQAIAGQPSDEKPRWQPSLYIGGTEQGNTFSGKIADVQVWNTARSPRTIRDSMYLSLTGREIDLAGYWRLGAITAAKQVLDFSVHGQDATVYGDAFVSAVSLYRTLKDGAPVVRYTNDELFAVSQRATYDESFEFKLSSGEPLDLDPLEDRPFTLSYWGKTSRGAAAKIDFESTHETFEALSDGWYRATARFTVPDDITLVRAFEISDVSGEWQTLEIRKHSIRSISNTVTRSQLSSIVSLSDLPAQTPEQQTKAREAFKQLPQLEGQEAALLREYQRILKDLTVLRDENTREKLLDELNTAIKTLEEETIPKLALDEDEQRKTIKKEIDEPTNYWYQLVVQDRPGEAARLYRLGNGQEHLVLGASWSHYWSNQTFRFDRVSPSNNVYIIRCKSGRVLELSTSGDRNIVGSIPHSGQTQRWRIQSLSNTYQLIRSVYQEDGKSFVMDLRSSSHSVYGNQDVHRKANQQWRFFRLDANRHGYATDRVTKAKLELQNRQHRTDDAYRDLDKKKRALEVLNSDIDQHIEDLEDRLNWIVEQLKPVQEELNQLNNLALRGVEANDEDQVMVEVHTDEKTLTTTGALLGFIRPASRLSACETGRGTVALSYFDADGRQCQTHYDATADADNRTFEQWLPNSLRACLAFYDDGNVELTDRDGQKAPSLKDTWSLEAWFTYSPPASDPISSADPISDALADASTSPNIRTLVALDGGQAIAIRDDSRLGIVESDGAFKEAKAVHKGNPQENGYDLTRTSSGWHHLTAVGQGFEDNATVQFYLDGSLVAQADGRLSGKLVALGNHPNGGQSIGKLAEVRLWNVALNAEEVESNSKTLPMGNEPGLVAYYPLGEASGSDVRDRTGRHAAGTVSGANWFACTAPIGNPGHNVMYFNGINSAIQTDEIPHLPRSFTLEAWVKPQKLDGRQPILSKMSHYSFYLEDRRLCLSIDNDVYTVLSNPEAILPADQWSHVAVSVSAEGNARFYINGHQVEELDDVNTAGLRHMETAGVAQRRRRTSRSLRNSLAQSGFVFDPNGPSFFEEINGQSTLSVYIGRQGKDFWSGTIAELRQWKGVRSPAEIKAALHYRLTGDEPNLEAYWPLDVDSTDSAATGGSTTSRPQLMVANDLPLIADSLVIAEYSTISTNPDTGRKAAMLRQSLIHPGLDGVHLLTDKRVETLELLWIGNAQTQPTLLGYIEGPPPVPSENLTEEANYNGATSIELSAAEDVAYSWNREQDAGLGATLSLFAGVDQVVEIEGGIVLVSGSQKALETRSGFTGNLATHYSFLNSSTVSAISGNTFNDRLELRGALEQEAQFEHLGQRFMPKNVGYALVVSGLADVYVSRLSRSKRMIGYQVLPNQDVPPDINTITFMMNPAYTMNGSLDGLVGSAPADEQFYAHVSEMRSQYGSQYPASYYRLDEANQLEQFIDQRDRDRESYFVNFNSRLVDEASLNRQLDDSNVDTQLPSDFGIGSDSGITFDLSSAQNAEEAEAELKANQEEQERENEDRQREIETKIRDQEKRLHATESFAGWQRRMEDLQIHAGKRNMVNTYVWDADGGLRAESQQFASTIEHTIGASFNLEAGLGGDVGILALGVGFELSAQATVSLTQTFTKTESRSKGFELAVDLSGVESVGITDHRDRPLKPGEKVNRYRFKTFYLEGSTGHYNDFFNTVVDPEWLQSNGEEARALRQTQLGLPTKTWRVLHRVTYVERPALMGFGRDLR